MRLCSASLSGLLLPVSLVSLVALVQAGCDGRADTPRSDAAAADGGMASRDAAVPRDGGRRADDAGDVSDAGDNGDAGDTGIGVGAHDAGDSITAQHVCYVYDDCNGGMSNDESASACPMWAPEPGSPCNLTRAQSCFYCNPGQEARHWWEDIPMYGCKDGLWELRYVQYACE